MRILHITDFHYKSPTYSKFDQDKVVDKFLDNLNDKKIDLILFTGDLVYNGSDKTHFNDAFSALLVKLKKKLNLQPSQIFICPGNHDVDRAKGLDSLNNYFKTQINSNDDLDKFVNAKSVDLENSLKSTENYFQFSVEFYRSVNVPGDNVTPLYTTHIRVINGRKIGIVAINSAWRSIGDDDEGNLFFPPSLIKDALQEIKDAECKILLVHHPLHWLKGYNYLYLQNLIHSSFNMLFSGHLHISQISSHFLSNNGIFSHFSPASFTYDKDVLGFSIIDFDFNEEETVKIERAIYSKGEGHFSYAEPIVAKVPCGERKDKQNQIRKKIIGKYDSELTKANELLLNYIDGKEEDREKFIELFSEPVLRRKPKAELSSQDAIHRIDFNDILNNDENFLILGNDKSGKTSLLKRVQLYHLKNYPKIGNVPFYIDYKEFDNRIIGNNLDLIKLIRSHYELNYNDTLSLISEHKLKLLIDNFDPRKPLTSAIVSFLNENPSVNYVVCSNQTTSMSVELLDFGPKEFAKLFLHELGRKEIRSYANKWKEIRSKEREPVIEKVINLCKQLEIPVNYWTISLFLLIHQKMNNDTSKNLFEVLDLCVDEMLNKKYLVLTRSRVKFEQLKKICAEIAYYLLTKHRDKIYSATFGDLLNFLDNFLKDNPRITADPKEIIDYLIISGVLKSKEDSLYTFRLNGIFEYFLAYYLTLHDDFKDEIISDDKIYLSFKNELEIYSGLKNDDEAFLKRIFIKTQLIFKDIRSRYEGSADETLSKKVISIVEMTDAAKRLRDMAPFNPEIQDELREEMSPLSTQAEIKAKEIFDTDQINSDLLERYLSILSRVFKNTDEIRDIKIINEIFDFIIDAYILFGFYLVDEIEQKSKEFWATNSIGDQDINLLRLISNIIPIVTQVSMYDGLGHYNLEQVIQNKIQELRKDEGNNQYKLFLLHLLLVDIDSDKYHHLIQDLIEILRKGVLKTSLIFKLNYYLAFKAYNKPEFEHFLKQKIEKAQLRIDDKIDKGVMQKELEKRSKKNIIKRDTER